MIYVNKKRKANEQSRTQRHEESATIVCIEDVDKRQAWTPKIN